MIEPGRLPNEPDLPYNAFCCYLEVGVFRRSFAIVSVKLACLNLAVIARWARRYRWIDRANEWDRQMVAAQANRDANEAIRQAEQLRAAMLKPFYEALESYNAVCDIEPDAPFMTPSHLAAFARVMWTLPMAERAFDLDGNEEGKRSIVSVREVFEKASSRRVIEDLLGHTLEVSTEN